jgi:2-phospho-L-lactate guanylyltransferase
MAAYVMTTWAILPVKHLHQSKRRLAHLLSADERAALIGRFLDNLLLTLHATPGIDRTLVVTCDPAVVRLARRRGADVLPESAADGLNTAVERGAARAAVEGATAVLLLPVDLPFARVDDIAAMLRSLATGDGPLLAICGDEAGQGTNALLLAPPGDFTFHYGPGSFAAHLAEAERRGRATCIVRAPGLRFDLDTERDWWAYSGHVVGAGEAWVSNQ